ncbi:MAG TPA: GAF domain-containing protein [Vicinamibacterales bacterium]|jgi:PAS domain S-box-containing protein
MQKRAFGVSTRFERMFRLIDRFDAAERRRLRGHAVALLLVAAAVALKVMFGATGPAASFALLNLAVAGAALAGGLRPAFLAALAAVLSARVIADAGLVASIGFFAETMLVAGLLVYVRTREEQAAGWLAEADAEVRDLRTAVRQHRIVGETFDDLERASRRHAAIVLTGEGAIGDWRPGAARLYLGGAPQAIGASAARFFYPPLDAGELKTLLDRARAEGTVQWRGVHQRFDGTIFDVDVQLRCLVNAGGAAFSMVVHDLTDRHAAEALARHAAERQDELREEVTLAQEQLASLELVTDPFLNAVPGAEAVALLLDRLRTQVNADGIAIVRRAGLHPRLFCAADGIRPEPPEAGSVRGDRVGRALLIHNDEARVADMTVARWPAGVRSLIAVPLLQNGEFHATMEVVYQRGARSTDWEIALIQVAAARAATMLPIESYAGTGAVA